MLILPAERIERQAWLRGRDPGPLAPFDPIQINARENWRIAWAGQPFRGCPFWTTAFSTLDGEILASWPGGAFDCPSPLWYDPEVPFSLLSAVALTTTGTGQAWTVDSGWNSANNLTHVLGGGADGGTTDAVQRPGGGGSGTYANAANLAISGSVNYQAGKNKTSVGAGTVGDLFATWFNGGAANSASCGARAGGKGYGSAGAFLGGDAGISTGNSGSGLVDGSLGGGNPSAGGCGGGAGAPGPNGIGVAGSDSGGAHPGGHGGNGDNGFGGLGGAGGASTAGSPGSPGVEIAISSGPGGGGGGGDSIGALNGGAGGLYGAGGGGGSTPGLGGQGLVLPTWTPLLFPTRRAQDMQQFAYH